MADAVLHNILVASAYMAKWKERVAGGMQTLIKKVIRGVSDYVKGCAGNWQAHLYQCLSNAERTALAS